MGVLWKVGILLQFCCALVTGNTNMALGKPAWQSSEYTQHISPAGRATDGIANPIFNDESCTHTAYHHNPGATAYWITDLEKEIEVASVEITNRGDCCHERLTDFFIAVSKLYMPNSMERDDTSTRCKMVNGNLYRGETRRITCDQPLTGRYVSIHLTKPGELTLCEVKVFMTSSSAIQDAPNLARGKVTWQSSDYFFNQIAAISGLAVDGNPDSNMHDPQGKCEVCCTHTNHEYDHVYWAVDLGREETVTHVALTNRGDCCEDRLGNFHISVGNSFDVLNPNMKMKFDPDAVESDFQLCASVPQSDHLGAGQRRVIVCDREHRGRYVVVWKREGILTLCEAEVFGSPRSSEPICQQIP